MKWNLTEDGMPESLEYVYFSKDDEFYMGWLLVDDEREEPTFYDRFSRTCITKVTKWAYRKLAETPGEDLRPIRKSDIGRKACECMGFKKTKVPDIVSKGDFEFEVEDDDE